MAQLKKLAVLVVLLAIPALLFAQAQDQGAAQSGDQQQAQGSEEKAEGAEYAQAGQQAAGGMNLRLSEAIGIALKNEAGDIQGTLNDLVITPQGDIPYAVVAFSAPANVGQDLYLVPVEKISVASEGMQATLNLSAADTQGLQKLENGQLPAGLGAAAAAADTGNAGHFLATQVRGTAVVGADGQPLGTVEDGLLDLSAKKIAGIAIVSAGELGLGEGLYAIPVGQISSIDMAKGQIAVSVSPDQLKAFRMEAGGEPESR